ncbi:Uncharacterised protein [BD1-7 clade bacterium]|uniref:Tc toxin complex TcA C-terminal TcB-binding domain-containing protein n=1 Tax=BD1-7 clade bacterium TaxID=2029982 RepID=A0A5S9Q1E9_9GAMM|nr:Uncharacterised protein [BD1-7 clade bacterium]CAA0112059.1 Uncharacterised protein [BD1-7 clade bacterium]
MKVNTKFCLSVSILSACVFSSAPVSAQNRVVDQALIDTMPELKAAWQLLRCGTNYKAEWFGDGLAGFGDSSGDVDEFRYSSSTTEKEGEQTLTGPKTYKELLSAYNSPATVYSGCADGDFDSAVFSGLDNHKSEGFLNHAIVSFNRVLHTPASTAIIESATWGLQESVNAYIEGQSLFANDLMLNGLRSRFRVEEGALADTPLGFLTQSASEFSESIGLISPVFITNRSRMRADIDKSQLPHSPPYMVINHRGPKTPNEYQRYTELLNRYGMAAGSEAKYLFYRDNVVDVDNTPKGNFPGPEDKDFNADGVLNEAGRLEAAKAAKVVGSHIHMGALLLAATQTEEQFADNDGYQLKRQVNDMDRLHDDIKSGFNPLLLAGDFVPYQPVENFLHLARRRVDDAIVAENAARSAKRVADTDRTSLRGELQGLTERYKDQLHVLTGVPVISGALYTDEKRQEYLDNAHISVWEDNLGEIGVQVLALQESELQIAQLDSQMKALNDRIQTELERNQQAVNLVIESGRKISLQQYANTMASCCNVSAGTSQGVSRGKSQGVSLGTSAGGSLGYSFSVNTGLLSQGTSSGVSWGLSWGTSFGTSQGSSEGESWGTSSGSSRNPNIEKLAEGQSSLAFMQAIQQAELDSINSTAQIKNLINEMATLYVSIDQAIIARDRQFAVIETMIRRVEHLIANYNTARDNFTNAYFNNPAYRLEASRAEQEAEDTFETAMSISYEAAKALEYLWSENFNNPVLRLDGGLPEPLEVSFDPFVRAESLFAAEFADAYSPSLDNYLDALEAWDVRMRQLRSPEHQEANVRFSIRDDILGFGSLTAIDAEKHFARFIAEHRVNGDNNAKPDLQFEFTIDIADESLFPNHPNIKIETVEVNLVSSAARSVRDGSRTVPALVDLVMLDRAYVRTFFADYPSRDDILTYELQSGRTIDKSPFIATVGATVDSYANPAPIPNTQLANHSPAVSTWVLRIRSSRFNNKDLNLEHLSDIELNIKYSYGKPRDIQFQ